MLPFKHATTFFEDAVRAEAQGLQHSLTCKASHCPGSIRQRSERAR